MFFIRFTMLLTERMSEADRTKKQTKTDPEAVVRARENFFEEHILKGVNMETKTVLKRLGKRGLLSVGLFSLVFAASTSAGTYYDISYKGTITENVYLGELDKKMAETKLGNSGEGTGVVDEWLTSVLGPKYMGYTKIDPVTPQYEVVGHSTLTAFELPSAPEYFFIKTGNVNSGYDHFLYQNNDSNLWGFVDSKDWGTDSNIYKVSHVGTVTSPVPVPAAAWLLGAGLAGLVGVRRRAHK